ncbi:hypothetical protein AOLI_G00326890 [Acnodon oligacanthus]
MSSVSASAHYLRTSFGLMDDVLKQIHTEVTAVLRTLALERKDVLSTKAAVTFTSTLLDDLLDQINSTFMDLFVYANSPCGSHLTANTETDAVKKPGQMSLTRQRKPHCERVLETVLSNFINEDNVSAFHVEASKLISSMMLKLVSEKILKSTEVKVREILVMNLLMMFETVISSHDSADLNNSLRSGSEKFVKSVVQRVREALADSVENSFNWSVRREFLESVEVKLDLLLFRNSSTEEVDRGIEEFENHSKKQRNGEEPMTKSAGSGFLLYYSGLQQMTMTAIQTILVCYIGHTCWRLRRKTVCTKKHDGLDKQVGHKQCKAGDVIVKAGQTLYSCFLQLYCIIFHIVQNPMLDHFIMLVVWLDTGWRLSAVDSCLLVFCVMEAVFKILMRGTYKTGLQSLPGAQDFERSPSVQSFTFAQSHPEMFNESDPEHFGSIFRTIFTLFQILMLDDWSLIYMTNRDNGKGSASHIIYYFALCILVELFTFLNLFIAVLVDNVHLSIHKKRQCNSQKSPDVKEGEIQSSEKVEEVLEVSQSEIEEELYKEALRHASSESKHSKRKIELITRCLQLLAAMEHHMQKYRAQACLLDNLVETFFTDRDEETKSDGVEVSSNLETKCSHAVHPPSKENEHDMGRRDECCTLQGKIVQLSDTNGTTMLLILSSKERKDRQTT